MIRRPLSLIAALAAASIGAGCNLNLKPGATTIFEAMGGSDASPIDQSLMATNKYDANARYLGTLGLANQPFASDPIYVRLFENNLTDADPAVRAAAARGLANHGEPRHAATVAKALRDPNILVRLEAARGLQRLHDNSAIDPLCTAAHEPTPGETSASAETDPEVRAEAAFALGQYAEPKVLRALIAALDDSDLAVNRSAQRSLTTLTGQDLGLDRSAWQSWADKAESPFAGRGVYTYPVYNRKYRFYEYIPLVPKPPNEVPAPPTGMPR